MNRAEQAALHRKMQAILVRVGVACSKKQAEKNNCITCKEMYRRFDELLAMRHR